MFFKDKGNGAKKTGARAWKPHSQALRECLQKVQRGANTHSYPERPNRCTGVWVLALDTGLGRVPGTGGHLWGLWMRKRVARGLSSPYRHVCVSVCVCARTCVVRMHVCGTWMRVRVCDVGGVHLRVTVTQAWDRRAGLEPERSWCVLCLPTAAAEPARGRCSRIRGDRIGGDRSGPGPAKRGAQLG